MTVRDGKTAGARCRPAESGPALQSERCSRDDTRHDARGGLAGAARRAPDAERPAAGRAPSAGAAPTATASASAGSTMWGTSAAIDPASSWWSIRSTVATPVAATAQAPRGPSTSRSKHLAAQAPALPREGDPRARRRALRAAPPLRSAAPHARRAPHARDAHRAGCRAAGAAGDHGGGLPPLRPALPHRDGPGDAGGAAPAADALPLRGNDRGHARLAKGVGERRRARLPGLTQRRVLLRYHVLLTV